MNRRPQLRIVAPAATPEEAAAVVAALERHMRETAPAPVHAPPRPDPWARAALLEVTGNIATGESPWGGGLSWGVA